MAMNAVAARSAGPRVLRVGLIQGGKIVEERIIRKRETVCVGTSEKNHFIVQAKGLPGRFELFQLVGNDYILNFTSLMSGRVGLPSGVQDLDQLRKSGAAREADSYHQVKLTDSSRGKVVIGDTTLLFQFVAPPPVTPRPQLPAAATGGFVAGIDWPFTSLVVFSYMAFFGFIIYLENADWPIERGIQALPDAAARLIFQEPEPPEEPQEEPQTDPVDEEKSEPEKVAKRTPIKREPTKEPPREANSGQESEQDEAAARAEARARIAEEAAAQAESMILGALGEGGALADVLAGGAVTGNAEEVMAQASGVGVASRGASGTLRTRSGGAGSGQGAGLGALRQRGEAGRAAAEGAAVQERRIRGRVNFSGGADVGGSGVFAQGNVTRAIGARRRAFQACYERELRNNPTVQGKVTVQFTIVPAGTVSAANAVENTSASAGLAACVVSTVRRLRFNPGPEGGSVSFRYPFVFAPQN